MSDIARIIGASLSGLILCFVLLQFLPGGKKILGHDRGRKFVEGSEVNIGKPTGVGIYFTLAFIVVSLIFCEMHIGICLMLALTLIMSVIGFLDDRSKSPWGEYSKGALDFVIALCGGAIFVKFFGSSAILGITGMEIAINPVVYAILACILFVVSINATNATDGVDGLSGTLTMLTMVTSIAISIIRGTSTVSSLVLGLGLICILVSYLWFNHFPSKMLMGDAGSRAIGFFIAFYLMYIKMPFAYLIICLPFLIDGGLSILKITIGRLTKKKIIILKNVITPIHDHLKKKKGFSVPKTWLTICLCALIIDAIYILLVTII